jgi:hypothetical protein
LKFGEKRDGESDEMDVWANVILGLRLLSSRYSAERISRFQPVSRIQSVWTGIEHGRRHIEYSLPFFVSIRVSWLLELGLGSRI